MMFVCGAKESSEPHIIEPPVVIPEQKMRIDG